MEDLVIIGTGPAGIAAAIQLKRCGYDPMILEKNKFGGLLLNANRVDNYPGFPEGISGIKLVKLFRKHFDRFGINLYQEEVKELDFADEIFFIKTNKKVVRAKKVILATGTNAKILKDVEIPNSSKKRIFYEIHPILNLENKKIVIVGAGDAAFDYALNLGQRNIVNIFNRGNETKGLTLLVDECKNNPNIKYRKNSILQKIRFESDVLLLTYSINEKIELLNADFLVFAIGRTANLSMLSNTIKQDYDKLVNSKRLFFIGDVKNGNFRQVSISVADGIRTAMEIYSLRDSI